MPFAGSSAPSGWAICDGSEVSIASYGQLYGRIGTTWNLCTNPLTGGVNGAPAGGNFRLPDLRGTFLRGVGDFADNTKDTTLGGFQADQFQIHAHDIVTNGGSGGSAKWVASLTNGGAPNPTPQNGFVSSSNTGSYGTETRPQNVGINYLIKLYDDAGSIVMAGSPFIGSEFQPSPLTITGNNTLSLSKFYTISSAAPTTQTLPAATGSNGVITVENTGTALVTVDGNGSETINGIANQIIGQYASLKLRDYAAGKWIVMH
jgi:microcystin-dependent protein